jgi:hypothetical protein
MAAVELLQPRSLMDIYVGTVVCVWLLFLLPTSHHRRTLALTHPLSLLYTCTSTHLYILLLISLFLCSRVGLSILRNSRWRGSTLRIEQAKESPLTRYRAEREVALSGESTKTNDEPAQQASRSKPLCGVVIDPLVISCTSAPLCVVPDERPLLHRHFAGGELERLREEIKEEHYSAAYFLASGSSDESSSGSESELDCEALRERVLQCSSSSSSSSSPSSSSSASSADEGKRKRRKKPRVHESGSITVKPRVPSYFERPEHALTVASTLAVSCVDSARKRRAHDEQSSDDEQDVEVRRRAFESAQLAEENRKASAVLSSVLALDALMNTPATSSGGVVSFVSSDEDTHFAAVVSYAGAQNVVSFESSGDDDLGDDRQPAAAAVVSFSSCGGSDSQAVVQPAGEERGEEVDADGEEEIELEKGEEEKEEEEEGTEEVARDVSSASSSEDEDDSDAKAPGSLRAHRTSSPLPGEHESKRTQEKEHMLEKKHKQEKQRKAEEDQEEDPSSGEESSEESSRSGDWASASHSAHSKPPSSSNGKASSSEDDADKEADGGDSGKATTAADWLLGSESDTSDAEKQPALADEGESFNVLLCAL